MLTYATVQDFLSMKDINKQGNLPLDNPGIQKIEDYLERSTRFIEKQTRRHFFPWIQERQFAVPHARQDLAVRRSPWAQLDLDQDLLEALVVNTGNVIATSDDYYLLEHNVLPYNMIALRHPKYWGNITYNSRYDDGVIKVTGLWGYADENYPYEFWVDTGEAVAVGGITSNATSIVVTSSTRRDALGKTAFLKGRMLRIDNELIEITAVNTTTHTLTVLRGVKGSTAVAHTEGTSIKRWRVIEDMVEVCLQVASTWREADIQAGGRLGVSEISTGVEIGIPSDPLMTIKSYRRPV